jgi:methylated-DNA-protein-cysteine methyltransferase related protein
VTADEPRDRRLLDVVRALQPGEVTTYGDVAATAGYVGRARLVGRLLATTTDEVPWWRVVTSAGRLAPDSEAEQAGLLRSEGVTVRGGRVVEAPIGRFRRSPSQPGRTRA